MNWPEFPLHFLRPWWWLALLPLPAALWALVRGGGGQGMLSRIADAALLPHLIHEAGTRKRFALGLTALAWLLAVVAMAAPGWQKVPTPLYVNDAARVVALSLSDHMLAQDVKPDRMTRARFAVRDLLDGAGDARTALVAYAGAAFTVAPLTDDKRTVLNLLRALRPDVMPVPGNDAAAGIRQASALLQQAHAEGGEIVVVTDTADDAAVAAARAARSEGIRVDVLGTGTTSGAPVPRMGGGFAGGPDGLVMARRNDRALAAVARAGGGSYAVLQADGSGAAAFGAPVAESGHASDGERAQVWRDGGIWLLPVLVVLVALAFRRGWLLVLAVLALPAAMPAHAATWSSLWANRDQRALHALQRGDPGRAQRLATTPGVRGAAEYRGGDYAGAARAFAHGDGARAHYNLGNALAKQGEYRKAVDAYRQALKQDPGFADAHANLEAVEAWLKKHAQSSAQPRDGQDQTNRDGQSGSASPQSGSQQGQPSRADGTQGPGPPPTGSPGPQAKPAGGQSNPSATPQRRSRGPDPQRDGSAASAAETARQQHQKQQAAGDLERELQGQGDQSKTHAGAPHAFALGQSTPRDDADARLDARQRAMLRSVPDDPGALLRRKFRLEWEQRNGRQQENGP